MKDFPLHEAVLHADLAATEDLLRAGTPLNTLDEHGYTPLHWAIFGGYEDIVRILLVAGANPNAVSGDGVTPAWRAVDFGLHDIRQLLAAYGGRVGTNNQFNRRAFRAFNDLLGVPLPREERFGHCSFPMG